MKCYKKGFRVNMESSSNPARTMLGVSRNH